MELHPKVLAFAEQMQAELDNNSHKSEIIKIEKLLTQIENGEK